MEKTAKELRAEAARLIEQADKLECKAESEKLVPPDAEAQAVEREKYRIGISLNSAPMSDADFQALLKTKK